MVFTFELYGINYVSLFLFFSVKQIEVQAVEGRTIALPCSLLAPSRDKVYMVLWFRDDAGIPLYR
jgi:hypothetical protein